MELQRGMYVVYEGADGTSKSTTMSIVAERLRERISAKFPNTNVRETRHPGSTSLGAHLRKLVKYPHEIDPSIEIDELTRQMLYMVDATAFVRSILVKALDNKEIVFADRNTFISALVYGYADGLSISEITKIFSVITPPKMDRLYILQCPWEVGKQRIMKDRTNLDHYDSLGDEFHNRIRHIYDNLATLSMEMTVSVSSYVAIDDILFVDTNTDQQSVVEIITDDLVRLIEEREDVALS